MVFFNLIRANVSVSNAWQEKFSLPICNAFVLPTTVPITVVALGNEHDIGAKYLNKVHLRRAYSLGNIALVQHFKQRPNAVEVGQ